jgi:hypothetical protein
VKIYRYYKCEHGLLVLKDLEIRTSIPSALNDPFELSPNVNPAQFSQGRLEALLHQDHYVDEAYQKEGQRLGLSRKEFKRLYLEDVPRRAAEAVPNIPKNVERVRRNFASKFSKYWRLVCASLVHDSILMWSHYARDHTGLVLAFDTEQRPFSQIPEDCWLKVKYSDKKADYIYSEKDREFREKMFAVAASKATDWSYEKEVRIILADTSLREGRFLPLTPQSIAAVYVGCRTSIADKDAVKSTLLHSPLRHVELWHGLLDESKYELKFEN